ncbi:baseplate J/gp47 family protein [Arthrobacter sp. I2-34]|uniref:Baseplate J/gp47 family protein n=1 Tax=Arthrobacter hankyongi TaxID=2904801 RepID=A0ABS9L6Y3_9MICC|nr:baseplate J/gp47 family protein [Arthrobacter hankyongi]MCG2622422.1 baseplate J/gp47 family protein [Arthrobacter hankyongi]
MAEIADMDGQPVIDYTGRDYEGILKALRGQVPRKLPEWQDYLNEADFGNVLLQLFAHLGDVLSYYQDRVANESFLATATTRRSVIEHLRLIGYPMRTAAPAAAMLTILVPAGTRIPEPISLGRGAAFATRSLGDRPSIRFEYTGEASLVLDFRPVDPGDPDGPAAATVPVEEGRLISGEVLGLADGSPDQRYVLAHGGLILPPSGQQAGAGVTLDTTQRGAPPQRWRFRDTLAFSGPADHDFSIDIDENDQATLRFGDGTFGAVPLRGAALAASYRIGGGLVGNVPAAAITSIVNAPALAVLGAKVTNPLPATGGADRETIAHAARHAPSVFRSLHRAVTTADYEELARTFHGVGKVRASAAGWNRVTLYVAPSGGGRGDGKVSDVLELGLKRYLEDKRMLTQIIEVEDVDYVEIFVTAEVGVESYYVREDVRAAVEQAASALLDFEAVGFGETLYLSRFYDAIQSTPGVLFANITEFRAGEPVPFAADGRIGLGENQVPVPPADPGYAAGIKVLLVRQAGS